MATGRHRYQRPERHLVPGGDSLADISLALIVGVVSGVCSTVITDAPVAVASTPATPARPRPRPYDAGVSVPVRESRLSDAHTAPSPRRRAGMPVGATSGPDRPSPDKVAPSYSRLRPFLAGLAACGSCMKLSSRTMTLGCMAGCGVNCSARSLPTATAKWFVSAVVGEGLCWRPFVQREPGRLGGSAGGRPLEELAAEQRP